MLSHWGSIILKDILLIQSQNPTLVGEDSEQMVRKTTLTVKEIVDDSLSGTNEWEVTVSDFDEALIILEKLGLSHKTYQENTRDEFLLGDSKISIDHWSKLGYLLEIESEKVEDVKNCAELLGFDEDEIITTDIKSLYLERGIDLDDLRELKF